METDLITLLCSVGACCYLQGVMEFVLVKIHTFTINGSDGVYDRAFFYLHVVVDSTINGSDGDYEEACFHLPAVVACFG